MKSFTKLSNKLFNQRNKNTSNTLVLDFPTKDSLEKALRAGGGCSTHTSRSSFSSLHSKSTTQSESNFADDCDESKYDAAGAGQIQVQCVSSATYHDDHGEIENYSKEGENQSSKVCEIAKVNESEWHLENYDKNSNLSLIIEEEVRRLEVLKSYDLLDTDAKAEYDLITSTLANEFDVPIALISLLDLGRKWYLSSCGKVHTKEVPRSIAFCNHVVSSNVDLFLVPDTTKDSRFMENPLVVGPSNVVFYAGVPLISPEGYRLGSVCVIDHKPRYDFTEAKKEMLIEFANAAMQNMVNHREQSQKSGTSYLPSTSSHEKDPVEGCTGTESSAPSSLPLSKYADNFPDQENQTEKEDVGKGKLNRVANVYKSFDDLFQEFESISNTNETPAPPRSKSAVDVLTS